MAIQTTSNLTNSLRIQYVSTYLRGAIINRLYDQFAVEYTRFSPGMSMEQLMQGTTVQIPFLSSMKPSTTAISQTADITPQILVDAYATITPDSRGDALQWSENLDIQTFTNYAEERLTKLGENQAYSIDLLAQAAVVRGTLRPRYTLFFEGMPPYLYTFGNWLAGGMGLPLEALATVA